MLTVAFSSEFPSVRFAAFVTLTEDPSVALEGAPSAEVALAAVAFGAAF